MSRRSLYRAISIEGAGEPGVFALVFIFPTPVLYELLIHLRGQYGEPAICVWGEDDQKSLSIQLCICYPLDHPAKWVAVLLTCLLCSLV